MNSPNSTVGRCDMRPVHRFAAAAMAFSALATGPTALALDVGVLSIEVRGLHSDRGQALCFLYAGGAGFPGDPARAVATVRAPIRERAAGCRFPDLAPGAYAVAVVHDENGDGRLNRNLVGLPAEGVGASNNPKSRFGPPKYDDARFDFPGGALTLSVLVRYL
jgi:uncharacterized protein (DUF2141 family)